MMCTEYLFDGVEITRIRDLQARVSVPLEWGGGNADWWPDPGDRPDSCLCGVDVHAAALASGWIETSPPVGNIWPYGGCFVRGNPAPEKEK